MEKIVYTGHFGLSKTRGALFGEKMAISELPEIQLQAQKACAELICTQLILLFSEFM